MQLLKERQAADGQHDSHIGEPIDDSPSVSDHVSSLDAQSLLQLHTTSPRLQTAASPMGLGEAVASSIDSLLSNDPRIATMARDFESEPSLDHPRACLTLSASLRQGCWMGFPSHTFNNGNVKTLKPQPH